MDFIPDLYTQTVKGEDKNLFRNAGTQMTSRALFPGSHYRMCSSKMRRKPRKKNTSRGKNTGMESTWTRLEQGCRKLQKRCPRRGGGGGGTDIFRPVGVVDGHKTEVLEHVE